MNPKFIPYSKNATIEEFNEAVSTLSNIVDKNSVVYIVMDAHGYGRENNG